MGSAKFWRRRPRKIEIALIEPDIYSMTRHMLSGFLFALWLCPIALAAQPLTETNTDNEVQGGRAALERFAANLDSFHASFEQVVLNSDGETQDANAGEMWRCPDLPCFGGNMVVTFPR